MYRNKRKDDVFRSLPIGIRLRHLVLPLGSHVIDSGDNENPRNRRSSSIGGCRHADIHGFVDEAGSFLYLAGGLGCRFQKPGACEMRGMETLQGGRLQQERPAKVGETRSLVVAHRRCAWQSKVVISPLGQRL